jgi:hypothetical protein
MPSHSGEPLSCEERIVGRLDVLALDLEGTLVSNAVSQIARPGLYAFLENCRSVVPRLVIYTSVPEGRFRELAASLVAEGSAPDWFKDIEYVQWNGSRKDLALIPGAAVRRTLLIDDHESYVVPEQRGQWLPIASFTAPYGAEDAELQGVMKILKTEWGCQAG